MYTDTHCHISDLRIQHKINDIINAAKEVHVTRFLQAGVSPDDWNRQIGLAERYPNEVLCCFGIHPYFIAEKKEAECHLALRLLESLLPKSLGLGETGLDFRSQYLKNHKNAKNHQIFFFEEQIKMAKRNSKPIVLHIVRAHEEALNILKKNITFSGLVHAFNSNYEIALKYLDLGLYISIGGSILNPENHRLADTVKKIPLNRILIESDSPDQLPKILNWPFNEPKIIPLVAARISDLKGISTEAVLRNTTENFDSLFY